jgi:hypothetical protein
MRLFLFFSFIILLPGCTSIEVAKEVNKVATSIKKSVTNIIKNKEKPIEKEDPKKLEKEIELEKEIIKTEKKKEKKLVKQQKQIVKINFFSKTLDELRQDLGNPSLLRNDGGTQMARFDTLGCRLFFFFNSNLNLPRVEHFEIRDTKGNLIDKKEHIQNCYKNFKLT